MSNLSSASLKAMSLSAARSVAKKHCSVVNIGDGGSEFCTGKCSGLLPGSLVIEGGFKVIGIFFGYSWASESRSSF